MEARGAAGTERREEFTAYMTITDGQGAAEGIDRRQQRADGVQI